MPAIYLRCSVASAALMLLVGLSSGRLASPAEANDEVTTAFRRHALLIGCTKYRNLPPSSNLKGPINDVALMRQILVDRFGFTSAEIVEMTELSAGALQPDRFNIMREMEALVKRAARGDEIFILLSGHGSQQPNVTNLDDDDYEPDGLDEVFLPADTTFGKTGSERVPGIPDDQLGAWLTSLKDRGACVFLVADTCHSGSISRSPELGDAKSTVRSRYVSPDLFTTAEDLRTLRDKSRESSEVKESSVDLGVFIKDTSRGALVVLTAVPPHARELEQAMPPNEGPEDPRYGRLTYAVHQVLTQSQARLSYRELLQHIAWWYQKQGWFSFGGLEGYGLDREVLGKNEWKNRSDIVLKRSPESVLTINQGTAHGLSRGTILRVVPPVGVAGDGTTHGYVTITSAGPFTSTVLPTAHSDRKAVAPRELPSPGRCIVEEIDYGDLKMSIRVRPFSPGELAELAAAGRQLKSPAASAVEELEGMVAAICSEPETLLRPATPETAADVYLLVADDGAYLRRRGEASVVEGKQLRPDHFGPYEIGPGLASVLKSDLALIARAHNLRRLAGSETLDAKSSLSRVRVKTLFSRGPTKDGPFTPIDELPLSTFTKGDYLKITLRNNGKRPADVTVLYVDAKFQIQSLFPTAANAYTTFVNTLEPQQTLDRLIVVDDAVAGLEEIYVLAVERDATSQLANFAFLAQDGIRGGFDRLRGSSTTPLARLLRSSFIDGTHTRGSSEAARTYFVSRHPITVVKSGVQPQP